MELFESVQNSLLLNDSSVEESFNVRRIKQKRPGGAGTFLGVSAN